MEEETKNGDFVKIHRKLRDWGWFKDAKTLQLFLYFLLEARWKDGERFGVAVKRGQLLTGRKEIEKNTGMTQQEIRTRITRLKSTNEITSKSTNQYTLITVVKYEEYQSKEKNQPANQPANQPTDNQRITNDQPLPKKERKERKANAFQEGTTPSLDVIKNYVNEQGLSVDAERFYDYYSDLGWRDKNGKPVRSWRAKLKYWDEPRKPEQEKDSRPAFIRNAIRVDI